MTVVQTCPYAQANKVEPQKPPVTIRASLFFDGTLNNRTNTSLRISGKASKDDHVDDSYANDYSNVSKLESTLEPKIPGYDFSKKIYVEGIGTEDAKGDSNIGAGLGKGGTGVEAKVKSGLDAVFGFVAGNVAKDQPITYIHLDSFGFSRGAAAARNFIYQAIVNKSDPLKKRLEGAGYTVGSVQMKFVGLFDTVASIGTYHDNDTQQIHLDAVTQAEKVVQLAAAEEHRENFRLTNIKSAGGAGKQFFLPGVHSDVGGGYVNGDGEKSLQLFDIDSVGWNSAAENAAIERERKWLIRQGWYLESELEATNYWNEIVGSRKSISNEYSLIPLHMMANFAKELGLPFSMDLELFHWIPPKLLAVKTAIESYVASAGNKSRPSDWFNKVTPMLTALRHDYLHFSAYYGSIANAPQWSSDDPINGNRTRIIQDG